MRYSIIKDDVELITLRFDTEELDLALAKNCVEKVSISSVVSQEVTSQGVKHTTEDGFIYFVVSDA